MRITIICFSFLTILYSCKPEPTYNPFDSIFDVNVNKLVKHNCDTISAGCGYFNLSKESDKFSVFYQVYIDQPSIVVAKGLTIHIDTITTSVSSERIHSLFENQPIDTMKVDRILDNFNLSRSYTILRDEYSKYDLIYQDSIGNQFHFKKIIEIDSNDLRDIRTYELFISARK